MSKLAAVYAQSLFEIALEEKNDKEILEETKVLESAFLETPEFLKTLCAPMISKDDKLKLLSDVFEDKISKTLLNYLKVMILRKDAKELKESFLVFEEKYNAYHNIVKANVVTAIELSPSIKDKLKIKLEEITKKKILLNASVDENVIGGIVVSFNETEFDGTVNTRLKELKSELTKISF